MSGAVVGSPGTFLPVRPRPRSPSEFRVVQRSRKAQVQGALGMAVKLFVGGLSFSTSNERLREAFAACGAVESASVVTDRDTGRSRGFGFVEMATPEEAEQAIRSEEHTSELQSQFHIVCRL